MEADDDTSDEDAVDDSPGEQDETEQASAGGAYGYAIAAGALLIVAIFAQFQSERIAKFITPWIGGGPPAVTLAESYPVKPDGPTFDHQLLDDVLKAHVQAGGWIDYEALQADPGQLDAYITSLADAPLAEMGRDQRLALLINAYNACTLKLIIENYPLESIKDIPAKQRWDDVRWRIGEQTWSLSQIEHEQVRPNFIEPRIHFALVCAAVGCPPLADEAYQADAIEQQLQRQAEYVHAHDTWLKLPTGDGPLYMTALYDWYGGDFEQTSPSVIDYAAQYSPELQQMLDADKRPAKKFLVYDWKLNSVENARPR